MTEDEKLDVTSAEAKSAQFAELMGAAFFADTAATEDRIKSESLRKRSKAQRAAAKARPPAVRTAFIGFRTTPEIKAMVEGLRGGDKTITDVIEEAIRARAAMGERGDG